MSLDELGAGNARVAEDDAYRKALGTLGLFMDADGVDTHARPTVPPPDNDATWTQSRTAGEPSEAGAGIDSTGAPLGF